MKQFGRALAFGVATEAVLIAATFAGGIGPCGPGTEIGEVLIRACAPIASFLPRGVRAPMDWILGLASGVLVWSVVWLLILAAVRRLLNAGGRGSQ